MLVVLVKYGKKWKYNKWQDCVSFSVLANVAMIKFDWCENDNVFNLDGTLSWISSWYWLFGLN